MTPTLETLYRPLKITYGLVPLLAGLDKFVGLLADWGRYLSPEVRAALPVTPETFLMMVGVVEILVGVMVLTRWTRLGAYLAMGWLTLIALELTLMGIFDIAVRDLALAVGAFTLATVAEMRESVEVDAGEMDEGVVSPAQG